MTLAATQHSLTTPAAGAGGLRTGGARLGVAFLVLARDFPAGERAEAGAGLC